jgi:hypothetical protein
LDDEPLERRRLAKATAKWPTIPLRQEILVHTLEIYPLDMSPGILSFPALRREGVRLDMSTDLELCLAGTRDWRISIPA